MDDIEEYCRELGIEYEAPKKQKAKGKDKTGKGETNYTTEMA